MSEKFALRWNDYGTNVARTFSTLRSENDFYDVTLVSDDQQQFSAHKIVLSACSQYFMNVFRKNKHPQSHPLLCLEGVTALEINIILDYIYLGEAQLFQENLDRFLAIAQRFQLEGLVGDPGDTRLPTESKSEPTEYEDWGSDNHYDSSSQQIETVEKVKKTPRVMKQRPHPGEIIAKVNLEGFNVTEKINEMTFDLGDGKAQCSVCEYQGVRKHVRQHVETHIEGLSYDCDMCQKSFRSKNSLFFHSSKYHK